MSWAVNVKTLHSGGQVSLVLFSSVFLVAKMHVFQSAFMYLQPLRPHFVCACVIRASSWPSQSNACSPHSQLLCESLNVLSCRGEVECYAWPADILGQNMIGKEKVQFVLTCTCVSPTGPGRLKVTPSPRSASWRAANADGCCCFCCTVSGTCFPHCRALIKWHSYASPAGTSQYQYSRESSQPIGEQGEIWRGWRQTDIQQTNSFPFFHLSDEKTKSDGGGGKNKW